MGEALQVSIEEAQRLLERPGTIRSGLDPAVAEQLAGRLRSLGLRVELAAAADEGQPAAEPKATPEPVAPPPVAPLPAAAERKIIPRPLVGPLYTPALAPADPVNNTRLIYAGILLVGMMAGYFIGRAHMKYEMRSAIELAMQGVMRDIKIPRVAATPDPRSMARQDRAKQVYIAGSLVLSETSWELVTGSVEGQLVPKVIGKIRNTGDRTLKSLNVTAYLLDASRQPIYETSYPVVFPGGIAANSQPLRPNYVRDFEFHVSDGPKDWTGPDINVEVTRIEFEETTATPS